MISRKSLTTPRLWALGAAVICSLAGAGAYVADEPAATQGARAAQAAPDRLTCEGYQPRRVFLESQAWWVRTPGAQGTSFGHVHVGMCFPHARRVSGTVTFDARLTMHGSPGRLTRLTGGITATSGDYDLVDVPVGMTCASDTCEKWVRFTVDTRKVPVDGRVEWRFRPRVVEPDGKQMVASTGWQTHLVNGGRPVTAYRPADVVIARGWYTDVGYANSTISELPAAAVSGVWRPDVVMDRGAGGIPITSHSAHVDPAFHHGDHGWVVAEGAGGYRGALEIDTRRLADGRHRLVLKTDAQAPAGSTNSGVLVVPFVVDNP